MEESSHVRVVVILLGQVARILMEILERRNKKEMVLMMAALRCFAPRICVRGLRLLANVVARRERVRRLMLVSTWEISEGRAENRMKGVYQRPRRRSFRREPWSSDSFLRRAKMKMKSI